MYGTDTKIRCKNSCETNLTCNSNIEISLSREVHGRYNTINASLGIIPKIVKFLGIYVFIC